MSKGPQKSSVLANLVQLIKNVFQRKSDPPTKQRQSRFIIEEKRDARQSLKSFFSKRLKLLEKPCVVRTIVLMLVIIWLSEKDGFEWWADKIVKIQPILVTLGKFPVTIGVLIISLILVLIIPEWRWFMARPVLSVGIILLIIIFSFHVVSNYNLWAFRVVEVSVEGLSEEDIVTQFRANLNLAGTSPLDVISITNPGDSAKVIEAKRTLQKLTPEQCPEILIGPNTFEELLRIDLPDRGTDPQALPKQDIPNIGDNSTVTLNMTVGSVSFPLEGLLRWPLRLLSPNFREFSIQVIHEDAHIDFPGADDDIRIIVMDNEHKPWTVTGSRHHLPQLVNFLINRMVLDLIVSPSEQISDVDLAQSLGNRAFKERDYPSALGYYLMAESYDLEDPTTQLALGLTLYRISTTVLQDKDDAYGFKENALQTLIRASQAPEGSVVLPYLACMQEDKAEETFAKFNKTLAPDSREATQERISQLAGFNPSLGPGREISVHVNEDGSSFDLYYFSGSTNEKIRKRVYLITTEKPKLEEYSSYSKFEAKTLTLEQEPRQIFAVKDGFFYLTNEGLVNFFRSGDHCDDENKRSETEVLKAQDLRLGEDYTGGIRQILANNEYLFALGRFGQILRYNYQVTPSDNPCEYELKKENLVEISQGQSDARQIFLEGNTLYVLKKDGIWRISQATLQENKLELTPEDLLVADTSIQEIAVSGGSVYLLRQDDIRRYSDRYGVVEDFATGRNISAGRIVAAPYGLFVQQEDGHVDLISNEKEKIKSFDSTTRIGIAAIELNLIELEQLPDGRLSILLEKIDARDHKLVSGYEEVAEIEDETEWTFEGQAGQIVTIRMNEAGSGFDTFLTLLGPDGKALIEDDNSGGDRNSKIDRFILPETGSYTIIPRSLDTDTGFYRLSLMVRRSAVELGDKPIIGKLEDKRVWSLEGQAGQIVTIAMDEEQSSIDPFLTLVGPNGQILAADDNSGRDVNSKIDHFILPETGSYTIIPRSLDTDTGAYRLSLKKAVTQPLKLGETGSGRIGDDIVWTFEGQTGQIMTIRMNEAGSGFDSFLTLLGPDAQALIEDDNSGGDRNSKINRFILPETGSYTIIPRSLDTDTGAYRVSLKKVVSQRLKLGETRSGRIGADIVWTFEGQAGQIVTIRMNEAGSGFNAFLTLVGPNGQILAEDDDSGDDFNSKIDRFILPETGSYAIIPRSLDTDTGAYRLSLKKAVTQPLKLGETRSGRIGADIVWIFEGQAGKIVTISMNEAGSGFDAFLTLVGPNGQILAEDDDSGDDFNSKIDRFILSETGSYTIIPRSLDTSSGDYNLSLHQVGIGRHPGFPLGTVRD